MRVAVVGGGISGLALAYELAKHDVEVEVFERGAEVGGLACGFEVVPGVQLERFYHHLFQTDADLIGLAGELGLSDSLQWRPARIAWYLDGAVHPFDTPLDVLRLGPLTPWERIGLARTMLEFKGRSRQTAFVGLTVEEWFARRAARGVYTKLWRPMLQAKWGDAERVSAAWLWQKVRARGNSRRAFREQLGYPVGGFVRIAEALAGRIDALGGKIRLGTAVERLAFGEGRVRGVETHEGSEQFDAVVSTLPLPGVARLVDPVAPEAAEELRKVPYRGVVCHVVVMDRPLSDVYWLNIADRTVPLGGIVEHTNFVPPEHYAGKHIVYLFAYLGDDAIEHELSPDDFVAHHFPHVRRIFHDFDESRVEARHVFRTRFATPVYRHPYRPPPLEPVPGLWLADTSRIFPMDRGTSECVRLARYVTASVLGRPATVPGPI